MLLCRKQISARDRDRLTDWLQRTADAPMPYQAELDSLRALVRRGEVIPPDGVPPDMITMNSRFVLRDPDTGEQRTCMLVYPAQEAPAVGRISVLSPMGQALLGAHVGEEVAWVSTSGDPQVAIVDRIVYQPESAGHLHL